MGAKPRKLPVARRPDYVFAELDLKDGLFHAIAWGDSPASLRGHILFACWDGPVSADIIMRREDFERAESEGRAVDVEEAPQ